MWSLEAACSRTMFLITAFLTNSANRQRLPAKPLKSNKRMDSEMSKLPIPVIASNPRLCLKLLLVGRFLLPMLPSKLFVTQGGLPITNSSLSSAIVLKSKSKTLMQ